MATFIVGAIVAVGLYYALRHVYRNFRMAGGLLRGQLRGLQRPLHGGPCPPAQERLTD